MWKVADPKEKTGENWSTGKYMARLNQGGISLLGNRYLEQTGRFWWI